MMMSPAFNLFLKPAEWVGDAAAAAAAAARTITPVNALMTKINHSPFFDQDDGGQGKLNRAPQVTSPEASYFLSEDCLQMIILQEEHCKDDQQVLVFP